MAQSNNYKECYMYNDLIYEVCSTEEFHLKLTNDSDYAAAYFNEITKNKAVNDEKINENVCDPEAEKSNVDEYCEFEDSQEMNDREEIEEVFHEKDVNGEEDNEEVVEGDVGDDPSWASKAFVVINSIR